MSKNVNNDVTMNPPILMQPNLYCPRGTKGNLLSITAGSCRKMGINVSLRIQPFPLAPRRWGRFVRRNVCDSATEIPAYWWRNSMFTSGSHGVPNVNLLDFMFFLVGKVLWSFTKELQQNSEFFLNKNVLIRNIDCFVITFTFDLCGFCLSVVNNR